MSADLTADDFYYEEDPNADRYEPQTELAEYVENLERQHEDDNELIDRLLGYIYHTDRFGEPEAFQYLTQKDWDLVAEWGNENNPE